MTDKPVMLFGREMRKVKGVLSPAQKYQLGAAALYSASGCYWFGWYDDQDKTPRYYPSPHAAARALERKIRAAHKRLGKLIGGGK